MNLEVTNCIAIETVSLVKGQVRPILCTTSGDLTGSLTTQEAHVPEQIDQKCRVSILAPLFEVGISNIAGANAETVILETGPVESGWHTTKALEKRFEDRKIKPVL